MNNEDWPEFMIIRETSSDGVGCALRRASRNDARLPHELARLLARLSAPPRHRR